MACDPLTAKTPIAVSRAAAGRALAGLGQSSCTNREMKSGDGGTRFVIDMRGERPGDEAVAEAGRHLGEAGFRIVASKAAMGSLTIDAVRSTRLQGRLGRIGRIETMHLIVFGDEDVVHRIGGTAHGDHETLLLARVGDRVTLWRDVVDGSDDRISSFVNDDLPTLR
jgi:hypothetical protein